MLCVGSAHAVDELLLDMNPPNEDAEDLVMDDEDDSNDEDNWRNDYPEESSDDSRYLLLLES